MEAPGDDPLAEQSLELARLRELVKTLRARCPWDRRQTHLSLAPHLLEEAYEAVDAIDALARAEPDVSQTQVAHLQEELGDVLFQVFFHSELAEEEGRFTLTDVARGIREKLVERHPHVFGDVSADTAEDVAERWELLKRDEKKRRGVPDSLPDAMPSLSLALKVLKKADALGWRGPAPSERAAFVRSHVDELEVEAVRHTQSVEGRTPGTSQRAQELTMMIGETLIAIADLSRTVGVDAEIALRNAARALREETRSES